MAITETVGEQEALVCGLMQCFGHGKEATRDIVLRGSVVQLQDKRGRLQAVGVQQLFSPTFLPAWNLEQLNRFITEVAPAAH